MVSTGAVSVVIPSHNRADTLQAAVGSALAQDGADIEVLVCDDGSSDESEDVVCSFNDPRVRWLPGPRTGGPAAPRNRGVAAANGEWVAFLDSDDTWVAGKIDAQLAAVEATSASACATNAYRLVSGSDAPVGLLHNRLPEQITLPAELRANLVVTSSLMVRTAEIRRLGGFPRVPGRIIFEDYALWLRLASAGPIVVLDAPWVAYRDAPTTSVRGAMASELRCTANTFRDFRRWRRAQDPRQSTTLVETLLMARQLSTLVSVRDMARRSGWLPTAGARGA